MSKPLVVITGASSGIGAEIAKLFSKQGYPLLLLARRLNKIQELNLPHVLCKEVDVLNSDAVENAIKEAEKKYGDCDCIINNAGVMLLGEMYKQDPKEWKNMFDVNVHGVLNGIHAVLPKMIARKSGTIINLSSIAGIKTFPNHVVYCGTKFAVHAMSENLREEVSQHNVRVITIAPGAVETELLSHTTDNELKSGYENWKKGMGGVLSPQTVADAIYYVYNQPQNVCIREVVLSATKQPA